MQFRVLGFGLSRLRISGQSRSTASMTFPPSTAQPTNSTAPRAEKLGDSLAHALIVIRQHDSRFAHAISGICLPLNRQCCQGKKGKRKQGIFVVVRLDEAIVITS